ncbi:MAG: hypothetical protein ACJASF_001981 [Vicingaceae bacterium]|jgi:hypothetical protein
MKKFLINSTIFLIIVVVIHFALALLADNTIDEYYGKVSNGKRNSLVLGTSKALQGIIPPVIDSILGLPNNQLYNFSFTLTSSPFGEVYFNAIDNKIDPNSVGNYYIIAIDPWSISEKIDSSNFENLDKNSVLHNLDDVTSNPNFQYLWKKYPSGWGSFILKKTEVFFLQKNADRLNESVKGSFSIMKESGWLKVYTSLDSGFVRKKETEKFNQYRKEAVENKFSTYRYNYFIKTIEKLKKHGSVYLVRLPVHEEMLKIEEGLVPQFTSKIQDAIQLSDGYFDMTKMEKKYYFTDGNHLEKSSSNIASMNIAQWIKSLKAENQ